MCITGFGRDGHLGFNEPGSSLKSRTREKVLVKKYDNEKSDFMIKTISDKFNNIEETPKTALTIGIENIMNCKEIVVVANGENKSEALYHIVECGISHIWPASVLQKHPQVEICNTE